MKPDNIYRTLVNMVPDLDSKQAWQIWQYIHELIDDETAIAWETAAEWKSRYEAVCK
jgi:hypothetical protein